MVFTNFGARLQIFAHPMYRYCIILATNKSTVVNTTKLTLHVEVPVIMTPKLEAEASAKTIE